MGSSFFYIAIFSVENQYQFLPYAAMRLSDINDFPEIFDDILIEARWQIWGLSYQDDDIRERFVQVVE